MQCATGMAALHKHLRHAVESRDAERMAILGFRVVFAQIRRVAIATCEDAAVTFEAEGQHRTGIGHDASLGVLYLHIYYSHIEVVGSQLLPVGLQHNL